MSAPRSVLDEAASDPRWRIECMLLVAMKTPWALALDKTIGSLIVIGAATLSTLGGCAKESPPANYPAPGASEENEPASGQAGGLTDGQIVDILTTVDSGEIQQARLARMRGNDPRVRQFAQYMIEQHTNSTQKAAALASRQHLTFAASDQATTLRQNAKDALHRMERASLRTFDVTYVKAQIEQHKEVLDMLREQLIPAADNQALTTQLRAAADMVEDHLNRAQEMLPMLQPDEQSAPGAPTPPLTGTIPQKWSPSGSQG